MALTVDTSTAPPCKPLRADAERNRQLIIEVAGQVFAEKGLDAGFDEIAKRAGVGAGTVYRRFPQREQLIEALLVHSLSRVHALAEQALSVEDAWLGLSTFLRDASRLQMNDQGLKEMLKTTGPWARCAPSAKAQLIPLLIQLLERAKEQGRIRSDIEITDLGILMSMVSSTADPDHPELWERYLTVVLDGLQPSRTGVTPLPTQAPSVDLIEAIMNREHASTSNS